MTKAQFTSGEEEIPLQNIYAALGHAIRFDIVQYLGTFHRPVQYTELVEWLQIKPGSFYFHMKKLKGLVEQDSEKRFRLTNLGNFGIVKVIVIDCVIFISPLLLIQRSLFSQIRFKYSSTALTL